MAVTTKVPLGEATLNRKWYIDVNTGTYGAPVWTGVFGVAEFTPSVAQTLQDDGDFDSGGWGSQAATELTWSIGMKVERKVTDADPTVYDEGQEVLRAAGGAIGASNVVDIRWYEYLGEAGGPEVEAYRGYASVGWSDDGGDKAALATATITLSGRGARSEITHPSTAAVPILYDADPATDVEAGGALITITGIGFSTAITEDPILFGAVASEDYVIHNDSVIYAVAPAQSEAVVEISVENATGVSTVNVNFAYTVA